MLKENALSQIKVAISLKYPMSTVNRRKNTNCIVFLEDLPPNAERAEEFFMRNIYPHKNKFWVFINDFNKNRSIYYPQRRLKNLKL